MKFGKHYVAAAGALPLELRGQCVDYRAWKRRIANGTTITVTRALLELESQCEATDSCFRQQHERILRLEHGHGGGGSGRLLGGMVDALAAAVQDVCSLLSCMCLFLPTWPGAHEVSGYPSLLPGNAVVVTPSQLLQFAHLNTASVSKTCKRLAKQYGSTAPVDWLTEVRAKRVYAFMGGHRLTNLALRRSRGSDDEKEQDAVDCPICLEPCDLEPLLSNSRRRPEDDNNNDPICKDTFKNKSKTDADTKCKALILPCGHVLCLDCTLQLAGVQHMAGNWYNKLALTPPQRASCPVCRASNALRRTWDMYLLE